jgi:hypothetical protein
VADERVRHKPKINSAQKDGTFHKEMLQKMELLPTTTVKQFPFPIKV